MVKRSPRKNCSPGLTASPSGDPSTANHRQGRGRDRARRHLVARQQIGRARRAPGRPQGSLQAPASTARRWRQGRGNAPGRNTPHPPRSHSLLRLLPRQKRGGRYAFCLAFQPWTRASRLKRWRPTWRSSGRAGKCLQLGDRPSGARYGRLLPAVRVGTTGRDFAPTTPGLFRPASTSDPNGRFPRRARRRRCRRARSRRTRAGAGR